MTFIRLIPAKAETKDVLGQEFYYDVELNGSITATRLRAPGPYERGRPPVESCAWTVDDLGEPGGAWADRWE